MTATSIMASYRNAYTYDANGNILTLLRNGIACKNTDMDNLTYHYYSGTNRLSYVGDAVASGNYTNDIDDQAAANYSYDAIGNLVADNAEGITSIDWNVYGKISSITKSSGLTLQFEYDAAGNRVVKRKTFVSGATVQVTTEFYIRDASGNVIANYSYESSALTWTESPIYGSSRVGVYRSNKVITNNINNYECCFEYIRGQRNYELTNHLGNVQAVITDKKIQVCVSGTTNHFEADVVSEVDYYPFGMLMPERSYASPVYRYGFNGKENDNEVKGEGNQQDYGFRISDPRLGRFLSVDPLINKFPMLTPYQYASNTPIWAIDLDGLEAYIPSSDPMWYIEEGVLEYMAAVASIFTPSISVDHTTTTKSTTDNTNNTTNQSFSVSTSTDKITTYSVTANLGDWINNRDVSAPLLNIDQSMTVASTTTENKAVAFASSGTSQKVSINPDNNSSTSFVSFGINNGKTSTAIKVANTISANGNKSAFLEMGKSLNLSLPGTTASTSATGAVSVGYTKKSDGTSSIFTEVSASAKVTSPFPSFSTSTSTDKKTNTTRSTNSTTTQSVGIKVGVKSEIKLAK